MGGADRQDDVQASEDAVGEETPSEEPSSEDEDHATTEWYVCVNNGQAREEASMESARTCKIEVDEVVEVLQKVDIEDDEHGLMVTRLQTPRGWVSEQSVTGKVLFEPADPDAVAAATLRRAATLRARAAVDSDDEDPLDNNKDNGCAACCCSFLRNLLLLVVALVLANLHYQLVDVGNLLMSAWYRVSVKSRVGLMQPTVVPPPPETPELTDPLYGTDVFWAGTGQVGMATANVDT